MRVPWICYSTPKFDPQSSSVKGVGTGAPKVKISLPHPPSCFSLLSSVDSIRSFVYAAGFAAARRCLHCFIHASEGRAAVAGNGYFGIG